MTKKRGLGRVVDDAVKLPGGSGRQGGMKLSSSCTDPIFPPFGQLSTLRCHRCCHYIAAMIKRFLRYYAIVVFSVTLDACCSMAPSGVSDAKIAFDTSNAELKSVADMRIASFRYVGPASDAVRYLTDSANRVAPARMTKVQLVFEPPKQLPEPSGFAPGPNDPKTEIELNAVTVREAIMAMAFQAKWLPPYERWDGLFYIRALPHP